MAAAALSSDAGTTAGVDTSSDTAAPAANGHSTVPSVPAAPVAAAAPPTISDALAVPTAPEPVTPTATIDDAPTERLDPPASESPRFTRPPEPPAPPRQRGKNRWLPIGIAAAALVAIAVIAVVLITGDSDDGKSEQAVKQGPSAETVYKQQVAKAFGPVLGANQKVSSRLASLKGTKPDSARLAVRQAQQATTAASGALSALTVPDGQQGIGSAAQQVIDREVAYLAAVSSVLNHPTVAGSSQLQTLSSNLVSALHAAGPTIAGEQETVSGAERLTSWARTTSRTLNRRAAAKRAMAKRASGNSGAGSSSSSGGRSATPSGTSCGGGVYAGSNTSCSFALNVRDAYLEAPGSTASVRVYSPVTDTTYTMNCRPSGSGTTCSGANNASVTF
jgi:hypothetical protein